MSVFGELKKIFIDDEGIDGIGDQILDGIDEPTEEPEIIERGNRKISAVRDIKSRGYEVMVVSPKSFDESLEIAKSLTEKKTIVLNLELLDYEQKQRVVDFLAGATYALTGHQQQIGEGVFIFTPNNVNITAEKEKKANTSLADAIWNQVK